MPQSGDERKRQQVHAQRAPRFSPLEIQRRLERRDQVRGVQDVPRRPQRIQHGGDHQTTDREIELRVPRLKRALPGQAAHQGVGGGAACGKRDHEPGGDGGDPGELDDAEQQNPAADEPPPSPRIGEYVLALFGAPLLEELLLQAAHIRNR